MTSHHLSDDALRHLDAARHALCEMLERFVRQHGSTDPGAGIILREEAELAHDVRAGLRGQRGFDQVQDLTSSRITLVNDAELEFGLELEHLTRDVKEATETALAHLHLRYLTLLDCDSEALRETPVGPEAVLQALSALLESLALAPAERGHMLAAWRTDLIAELKGFYKSLDKQFETAGILPKALKVVTKPSPAPAATAAPTPQTTPANSELDALRIALVGQRASGTETGAIAQPSITDDIILGQLREWMLSHATAHRDDPLALLSNETFRKLAPQTATSVEMLERIFERLSIDASLQQPVRELLIRLRIPFIESALGGEDLLRTAGQTVQRLVDAIGRTADTVPVSADKEHPAIRTLDGIVTELLASGALNGASLGKAANAVEAALERRNRAANPRQDGSETIAGKAERREAVRLLASRALHVLLMDLKSGAAHDFLARHWIHVLIGTLYRKGDKHPDWRSNLGIANEISLLGDSGRPAAPDLRSRVETALRGAAFDDKAVEATLTRLDAALTATGSALSHVASDCDLSISIASGNDQLLMLHHRGLAAADSHLDAEFMPIVGTWVDLTLPSGEPVTARVGWVGALRKAAMVCEPDTGRCIIFTRRAIGALEQSGDYRVRDSASLLERATRAALARITDPSQ